MGCTRRSFAPAPFPPAPEIAPFLLTRQFRHWRHLANTQHCHKLIWNCLLEMCSCRLTQLECILADHACGHASGLHVRALLHTIELRCPSIAYILFIALILAQH